MFLLEFMPINIGEYGSPPPFPAIVNERAKKLPTRAIPIGSENFESAWKAGAEISDRDSGKCSAQKPK